METEQNWKFGRCDRLTLDCDVDGGECFVRIINPVVVVASRAGALFAFDATSRDCLWSSDLECEVNCIDFDGRQVLIGSGRLAPDFGGDGECFPFFLSLESCWPTLVKTLLAIGRAWRRTIPRRLLFDSPFLMACLTTPGGQATTWWSSRR